MRTNTHEFEKIESKQLNSRRGSEFSKERFYVFELP
jgi:hypothetical protein